MKHHRILQSLFTASLLLLPALAQAHPGHSAFDPSVGLPHPGHESEWALVMILMALAAISIGARWIVSRRL